MAGAAPHEGSAKGKKKALDYELNLVPFIDLLSCCIAFLLITAVWTQIAGLQVASSGGPPDQTKEQNIDLKLLMTEKGYSLTIPGGNVEIPKVNEKEGLAYDRKALVDKLKTLKANLEGQTAITVQPEDAVAYEDLVATVDTCVGQQLRDVTVAPLN